ncbi:hypothetical protein BJ912DRAFT_967474, partial [Pholiota molesta]
HLACLFSNFVSFLPLPSVSFFWSAPGTQAFLSLLIRSWFTGYHAISCSYSPYLRIRAAPLFSVSSYLILSSYHRNNPRTIYLSLTLTMLTILEISF